MMCWWTLICLFPAEEDADEEVMRTVEEGLEESERPRKSLKKIDGTKKNWPLVVSSQSDVFIWEVFVRDHFRGEK